MYIVELQGGPWLRGQKILVASDESTHMIYMLQHSLKEMSREEATANICFVFQAFYSVNQWWL